MSKVTLAPLIPLVVQTLGVVDTKLTLRPDEDVALTLSGDWATVLFAKFAKVMVWARNTVTDVLTSAAGL